MKFKPTCFAILLTFCFIQGFTQNQSKESSPAKKYKGADYKISVYTPYLTLSNFGNPKTNTHHYEFAVGYDLTMKDKIGMKAATWKLFAPMGILLWDPRFLKESSFFPGRLHEKGIGVTYQRKHWKGLFTTVEVLPLFKTYLDPEKNKVGKGFKLYTTYHVGYHIPLFKGRCYIEPQIHFNYWPIDTNTPAEFIAKEVDTSNYFFFEPNIYLGVKF